jgi:hypothetical protein
VVAVEVVKLEAKRAAKTVRKRRYTYNVRRIRRDLSYSIQEIAELFALHPNAVRRWLKEGLRRIDGQKPHLVHGSDLIGFLSRRQEQRKRHCQPGEMFCCRCRARRLPRIGTVTIDTVNTRQSIIRGACELCGTKMNRGVLADRVADAEKAFNLTTTPQRLRETSDAAA